MSIKHEEEASPPLPSSPISRRQIIIGAATVAIAASVPTAFSATSKLVKRPPIALSPDSGSGDFPIMRYMLASVCMADGRLMVTGGYNCPPTDGSMPIPMNSAVIVDPNSGACTPIAPMNIPRARHAMVALRNGKVVVLPGRQGREAKREGLSRRYGQARDAGQDGERPGRVINVVVIHIPDRPLVIGAPVQSDGIAAG